MGPDCIGSKLVALLRDQDHDAVSAAPPEVNTLTGEGLAGTLKGADVVVDVSNSPSFEDAAVTNFFSTSTRNLLAAEAAEGVRHHVALSVVGTERLSENGYFRAKIAQENLIKSGPIPYTIVHATQFFEFVKSIADAATKGNVVKLSPALIQPMAADDVASAVGRVVLSPPASGIVEIAGPEQFGLDGLIRRGLAAKGDPREVISDSEAPYFGALLRQRTLLPGPNATLASTRFDDWVKQPVATR